MKYIHLNALFLMFVFLTSCGQSQTDVPEAYIKSEFKDTVTSYGPNTMVWGITEDRKGNIWFGANDLWRYDGSTYTRVS